MADKYYLNGKADWADSAFIASLKKEMVFQRDNQIGLMAPQIYLLDTLENPTNLYDIKADYLVLFFYDPDCGHCKKKTPVLKEAYLESDGDFEVAAICVGTDQDKWKSFIKKFELEWLDLADPYYKSNFRVQYNVRSTPQVYILNKNKEIIAKRLDVDQISGFVKDHKRIKALSK
jgi:protein-disulfide isomerase